MGSLSSGCRAHWTTKLAKKLTTFIGVKKKIIIKFREARPEVGAAREDEAVEVVGGAHGVDHDIGEGTGIEPFDLDVIAERRQVAVQGAKLAAAPVVVGVLGGRNRHFHLGSVTAGAGLLRVLSRFHVNPPIRLVPFFFKGLLGLRECRRSDTLSYKAEEEAEEQQQQKIHWPWPWPFWRGWLRENCPRR